MTASQTRRETALIAVLTFRRPHDLAQLLPLLSQQAAAVTCADVAVLVIDNDPDAGAADQVGSLALDRVRYVHEPRPGIAAGRNRALDEAADHDLIIFIDDDERPEPGWLAALLATHAARGACGVVGPVYTQFDGELDSWVDSGGFFAHRRLRTGEETTVAATNNLLLDLATVRSLGLRFDDSLGLVGGSDTLFTRRLTAAAGPLVWCAEARVNDILPAARATRSWVLRRHFRSGNSWSVTSLMLCATPLQRVVLRLRLASRGLVRIVGGAGRAAVGTLVRSERHRANGARNVARGLGFLAGAVGYTYAEYRRSPLAVPAAATVQR